MASSMTLTFGPKGGEKITQEQWDRAFDQAHGLRDNDQEVCNATAYDLANGWFDGGTRGNPGPAAWAACIQFPAVSQIAEGMTGSIGEATNNVAEYHGLINLLKKAVEHNVKHLTVRGDSKLVIEQMNGGWKVKHEDMRRLHAEARLWASQIPHVEFIHVPREENTEADRHVNEHFKKLGL